MTSYLYALVRVPIPDSDPATYVYKYLMDGTPFDSAGSLDGAGYPVATSKAALAVDPSDNVYTAAGASDSGALSIVVKKLDDALDTTWTITLTLDTDAANAIAVSSSSDVLVGFDRALIGGVEKTLAYLSGVDGSTLWTYDTGAGSNVKAVAFDVDGNCYVVGDEGTDTYSVWAFEADGTPLWTDDGSLGDHTRAVVYGDYLYVDVGAATIRFDLATGTEDAAFTALSVPPIMAFDQEGYAYGFIDAGGYVVYRLLPSLTSPGDWATAFGGTYDAMSLAVSPDGYVFAGSVDAVWQLDGEVYCYDWSTGVEVVVGWPLTAPGGVYAVATSPGLVGAFYSSWPVPPHIYVGNVRYE